MDHDASLRDDAAPWRAFPADEALNRLGADAKSGLAAAEAGADKARA
jgi:hypothetical protein